MNKKIIESGFLQAVVISLCVIIIGLIVSKLFLDYSYGDMYETHSMMRLDAIKTLLIYISGIVTFWGYLIWKELNLINSKNTNIKQTNCNR